MAPRVDAEAKFGSATADMLKTATPTAVSHREKVEPNQIRLFREPASMLRMTILGDRSYVKVQVVRAAPLSNPDYYIFFLDGNGEEICMVRDPVDLDAASRQVLREELDRRYMTAVVQHIYSVRNEFGVSYFDVQTNRGRREFVVQNIQESVRWLGDRRLLLMDVDGNRFEIPDLDALDKRSVKLLERML